MEGTEQAGAIIAMECEVVKIWIDDGLRMRGHKNRVDPDLWRPLIMSFQELYGLSGKKKERASVLAGIDEENYRIICSNSGGNVEEEMKAELEESKEM